MKKTTKQNWKTTIRSDAENKRLKLNSPVTLRMTTQYKESIKNYIYTGNALTEN